ncbi:MULTISPECIES: SPJ_0845 family protein [Enterococcus]|uniref:SPJ_0845 family protein n=1 Tax=Enterococcus TaxID=1350 RepID=UPI00031F4586|nr:MULTISPECIES: SPJ_0845 family protein [Enterococcus]MDB1688001.1 SPJ_0845 family protein [Enterococcus casseliflavus]MDO0894425.1 SPJ_0845 family protein [Enterococcus sp. B1E4]MDO0907379.1 SPJ_0845 family protein [Enterococcus sp. B2E4]MDO0920831.1 SPJ_0845 family protein [Enterococcus sp. B1E2]WIV17130.1 SPJ_0845 family protein [Enterococcus sp. FZMF]
MGLKFQREDSLDKMFDDFAFLPDNDKDKKKQENDIERFLKNESDEEKKTHPKDSKKAD